MATAKQTKKQVAKHSTKPAAKHEAKRKATPKGAEQVRRNAKYHDNDGETVGSADSPRKRFGDTGDERKVGRGTASQDSKQKRGSERSDEHGGATTRARSGARTRR